MMGMRIYTKKLCNTFSTSAYIEKFNTEQYYGGLRKLDYFLELHENLSPKLKSNGSDF